MTNRDSSRAVWLEWLTTTVISPVSLVIALLVYFEYVRRIAQSSALGFDASILQEPSIPTYLMRSVDALNIPLVVLTVMALVLLWVDRRLRGRLDDWRRIRSVQRISRVLYVASGLIAAAAVMLAFGGPLLHAYVKLAPPFLLAVAVLGIWYGISLRRAVRMRLPTRHRSALDQQHLAGSLLAGFLVALLLFAGVDGFAKVVGQGFARQMIEHPERHTRLVLLYSEEDLQLDAADAMKTTLPDVQDSYNYRYDGLRLAFVDGGSYFFIPRTWRRTQGNLIVLHQDDLRIEFVR